MISTSWHFLLLPLYYAFIHYRNVSHFNPHKFGAFVWPDVSKRFELEPPSFNPSIVLLPRKLRLRISIAFPDAHYLITTRRDFGNCLQLAQTRSFLRTRHNSSGMYILNHDMVVLTEVQVDGALSNHFALKFMRKGGHDIRVQPINETSLLLHYHGVPPRTPAGENITRERYLFTVLNLELHGGSMVKGTLHLLTHPSFRGQTPILIYRFQNLAVFWDGRPETPFRVVTWIKSSLEIRTLVGIDSNTRRPWSVRNGYLTWLRPLKQFENLAKPLEVGINGEHRHKLHNSFSPLLSTDSVGCPGFLLAIGHAHLDRALPSHRGKHANIGTTKWGNTYMQRIIAFNASEPHNALFFSSPFCFPSVQSHRNNSIQLATTKATSCDVIQFVMSLIVISPYSSFSSSGEKQPEVLITYGVNDCESAYVKFSANTLLDFLFSPTDRALYCSR